MNFNFCTRHILAASVFFSRNKSRHIKTSFKSFQPAKMYVSLLKYDVFVKQFKRNCFILSHIYTHFDVSVAEDIFGNFVGKRKIAHDKQFFVLPLCFQFYSMIKLSSIQMFHMCVHMFSNSSAVNVAVDGRAFVHKGE